MRAMIVGEFGAEEDTPAYILLQTSDPAPGSQLQYFRVPLAMFPSPFRRQIYDITITPVAEQDNIVTLADVFHPDHWHGATLDDIRQAESGDK